MYSEDLFRLALAVYTLKNISDICFYFVFVVPAISVCFAFFCRKQICSKHGLTSGKQ